ncbi:chitinase/predicted carbohydrate-binding protein with CBM5 and CBM33 domain [Serratia sp. BIGb0234]|uniref:lytic polysaccharide monooxygenase n=1 Tax=Serratia sp. BIGb0234 TaxID=2940614 RepID=UPI002169B3E3|nr:lytic polysaccharide monooxygenase [Serratia sp. BIGb0234]MCS4320816.1 chitinase/predicted carbohydrate-binding protein with CBM5 and CBM33 domain [Serratia sp. BIGb0234]
MSIKIPELLSGKGKIVMGFWHNWSPEPGQGYKQGRFTEMRLSEVPVNYNVIVVAFMKILDNNDHIPDFKPYKGTASEFRRQVDLVHLQGRKVLISLGGADAHIELRSGDEISLANRIIALTEQYDFDGLDIDLEQAAITAANNQTVIPSALKIVKDHFRSLNKNFIIGMAPEFHHLARGREYNTYIESLEGYYDYIAPQFYNQDGASVHVDGIGKIEQNNDVLKEDFLYYLTESLVTGTRGFIKIPHDKFIIGLPSNNDAAATGYVIEPQNVYNALERLKAAGQDILGLMTWSINWDAGFSNSGETYAWEFINRYGYLAGDGTEPEPEYPQWTTGKRYYDDDMVHWDSAVWRCLMVHDSNSYWAPNVATSLWRSAVIDNNRKGKITVNKCSSDKISTRKSGSQLRHGHVFSPASRAYIAWQEGKIDTGMLNQRECGKFFPALDSGLTDIVALSDVTNFLPPPDGKIASANQGNGNFLDDAGTHWPKHNVVSAEMLKISWYYSAPHSTRRWNYFITRKDWNPNLPLSRAQFEDQPFYKVELTEQPYWSHGATLTPPQPTEHNVMLPQRSGYHVLLAVWEVANTGNAFYHVIDLDFSDNNNGSDVDPVAPDGLRANSVTASSITLTWNASVTQAFAYRLYRDGNPVGQVTELTFTDSGLSENTAYSYAVSTLNDEGTESAPSQAIAVRTSEVIIPGTPPTQPSHLHSMGITVDTVKLMWGGATSNSMLAGYIIYRDGNEIARTSVAQLSYDDSSLKAETVYRYFVVAFDTQGQLSVPSNVLSVTTSASEDNGGSLYTEWKLGTYYPTGKKVSYQGKNWICLQAHTAYVPEWAPSVAESLWRETA